MHWKISIIKSEDLVSVKTSGVFNYEEIRQMTSETFNAATENGIGKILTDQRDMEPQISTVNIYILPREVLEEITHRPLRVALVYREDSTAKDDFIFFETTAQNAGMAVKLFTDPEEARFWLKV